MPTDPFNVGKAVSLNKITGAGGTSVSRGGKDPAKLQKITDLIKKSQAANTEGMNRNTSNRSSGGGIAAAPVSTLASLPQTPEIQALIQQGILREGMPPEQVMAILQINGMLSKLPIDINALKAQIEADYAKYTSDITGGATDWMTQMFGANAPDPNDPNAALYAQDPMFANYANNLAQMQGTADTNLATDLAWFTKQQQAMTDYYNSLQTGISSGAMLPVAETGGGGGGGGGGYGGGGGGGGGSGFGDPSTVVKQAETITDKATSLSQANSPGFEAALFGANADPDYVTLANEAFIAGGGLPYKVEQTIQNEINNLQGILGGNELKGVNNEQWMTRLPGETETGIREYLAGQGLELNYNPETGSMDIVSAANADPAMIMAANAGIEEGSLGDIRRDTIAELLSGAYEPSAQSPEVLRRMAAKRAVLNPASGAGGLLGATPEEIEEHRNWNRRTGQTNIQDVVDTAESTVQANDSGLAGVPYDSGGRPVDMYSNLGTQVPSIITDQFANLGTPPAPTDQFDNLGTAGNVAAFQPNVAMQAINRLRQTQEWEPGDPIPPVGTPEYVDYLASNAGAMQASTPEERATRYITELREQRNQPSVASQIRSEGFPIDQSNVADTIRSQGFPVDQPQGNNDAVANLVRKVIQGKAEQETELSPLARRSSFGGGLGSGIPGSTRSNVLANLHANARAYNATVSPEQREAIAESPQATWGINPLERIGEGGDLLSILQRGSENYAAKAMGDSNLDPVDWAAGIPVGTHYQRPATEQELADARRALLFNTVALRETMKFNPNRQLVNVRDTLNESGTQTASTTTTDKSWDEIDAERAGNVSPGDPAVSIDPLRGNIASNFITPVETGQPIVYEEPVTDLEGGYFGESFRLPGRGQSTGVMDAILNASAQLMGRQREEAAAPEVQKAAAKKLNVSKKTEKPANRQSTPASRAKLQTLKKAVAGTEKKPLARKR